MEQPDGQLAGVARALTCQLDSLHLRSGPCQYTLEVVHSTVNFAAFEAAHERGLSLLCKTTTTR